MKIITQQTIGKKVGRSQANISELKKGAKYTTDVKVAMALAQAYGKLPIDYINPLKRALYLKAYPRLGKPTKSAQEKTQG